MRVYVGAPIDWTLEKPLGVFSELEFSILKGCPKAVLYNPLTAWVNASADPHRNVEFVYNVNTRALLDADLAVFRWTGVLTFGVPIEIYQRSVAGKPVVIWNSTDRPAGLYMAHMTYLSRGRVVNSADELSDYVSTFNEGLLKRGP